MKIILDLFWAFVRIGLFTFGGGYAMLPMIQREIVENKKWATEEEIMNYYAVGQCTPGVIAVNTATFVGRKVGGVKGAISATLGVVSPSVVIITIIAAFIRNFLEYEVVGNALSAVNVAVSVLVVSAVITLWKKGVKNLFGVVVFVVAFLFTLLTDFSPVIAVVIAIAAGIIYGTAEAKKGGQRK